jgi:transposase, IS6 family
LRKLGYRDLQHWQLKVGSPTAPLISLDRNPKEPKCRAHLKQTNASWRVDETYVKVGGRWMYLYRAVDSEGNTLDFLLNQTRSTRAAKRFFRKVLGQSHIVPPRVINVDKNAAYIGAVQDLKEACV